jgi:hypothetical protein
MIRFGAPTARQSDAGGAIAQKPENRLPRLRISTWRRNQMSQPNVAPTKEQIEKRAYELYLARGCKPGMDVEDWLVAERELSLEKELTEAFNSQPIQ